MTRAIGVALTPIAFFTFTATSNVSFASTPGFTLSGNLSSGSNYYVGVYDSTKGWSLLSGPALLNNGLTFAPISLATTFSGGTSTTFVIFSTVAPIPTPTPTPSPVSKAPTGTYMYVGGPGGSAPTVIAYPLNGNGVTAPSYTISDPAVTRNFGLTVDSSGSIYVAEFGSIRVYAPRAIGLTTPVRVISGPATLLENSLPTAIAVSSDGTIYVTVEAFKGSVPGLLEFAPGSNGDVAPVRTVSAFTGSGATPPFTLPTSGLNIAFNKDGNIVVGFGPTANAGFALTEILTFPTTANGTPVPLNRFFALQNYAQFAISGDQIYVPEYAVNGSPAGIKVFPVNLNQPNATTNAIPQLRISGPSTGIITPASITTDLAGRLVLLNWNTPVADGVTSHFTGPDQVLIFSATASGDAPPVQTLTLQNALGSGPIAIGNQQ